MCVSIFILEKSRKQSLENMFFLAKPTLVSVPKFNSDTFIVGFPFGRCRCTNSKKKGLKKCQVVFEHKIVSTKE